MMKIGRPMVYVFLLKPFKQWNFEQVQIFSLANYFYKKLSFSNGKQFKFKFPLVFFFASFPSLKSLTGCLEKLEILAKRFGL